MKNRQKSRSGCRTCKLRRTKPGCRNCGQKGFDCPGYQQRLQWSTKHERSFSETKANAPINFTQLVTAASESIAQTPDKSHSDRQRSTSVAASEGELSKQSRRPSPSAASPSAASPSPSPSSPSSCLSSPSTSLSSLASRSPARDNATLVPLASREPAVLESSQETLLPFWQPVVDIPSFLIEHWFKSVCCSWSAHDSQNNPYRQLTSSLWSTSVPVFHALQAISAASLVERLPHVMRETARAAPRLATEAIRKELVAFKSSYNTKFPREIVLSLFCMSSSMCWMEARALGLQYVRQARAVLKSLDRRRLDREDQELLDFFEGCLIYEEMLRSVVSDDEVDYNNMLSWPEPPSYTPLIPASPHAWTGVSATVLRLFGKASALCRRSRSRWRHNNGTSYKILQGALKDIEEATIVEEALLAIDILEHNDEGQITDQSQILHDASEAYRLSSLLQLYETFPDLITKRIPSLTNTEQNSIWDAWVTPLALHITTVIERLPLGSMRCIQPLLCLCAGTGLRFDTKVPLRGGSDSYLLNMQPNAEFMGASVADNTGSVFHAAPISESAIKISQARQTIMARLEKLELSLPPKPIEVAKKLLRAVWSAYDAEIDLPRRTHWLDVMSYTQLHSLFG
ncbi:fungal-specific transcription factor domain-containing protein [Podospora appendiculata]|uniref:Fungal-specific transcription factor domain-containing protein n=1 Tax=Podospora appendiculata TaxID=314037 RepID=A0AAE1CBM4_9PEZI|nr:fungal-specific transcription factor domain-containing protein [Podospora appendiculata]